MIDRELMEVAYHEAGHAVLAHIRGQAVSRTIDASCRQHHFADQFVTTVPRKVQIEALYKRNPQVLKYIERQHVMTVAYLVGGYVAESRALRWLMTHRARPLKSTDYALAMDLSSTFWGSSDMGMLGVMQAEGVARDLLNHRDVWPAVEHLALAAVAAEGHIPADRANSIIHRFVPEGFIPPAPRRHVAMTNQAPPKKARAEKAAGSPKKRQPSVPRFRHPETGETWTGDEAMPQWVKDWAAAGRPVDEMRNPEAG